jgi:Tfp pilus assembly protein PilF
MPRIQFALLAFLLATSAIACSNKPAKPPSSTSKAHNELFTKGIEKLEQALALKPDNYASHWFIGKGYQALGDPQHAYEAFKASWSIHQDNPNVAREYMLTCMSLGHGAEGVTVAERALQLEPENAGLLANYALALLINGQTDHAMEAVGKSLAIDPNDQVTLAVEKTIQEVQSGKRPRPSKLGDLEGKTP